MANDPQPAALPTLSLTEAQVLTALRSFLLSVLPSGTEVVRGQDNRVPEPGVANFVVMTPLMQPRLGTNEVSYFDDVFTGSIGTGVLTVESIDRLQLGLSTGMLLLDAVWPTMNLAVGTVIVAQLTGSLGGTGTYTVAPSQTVASETMYAGTRDDLVPVELVVQLDVRGPRSGDNTRVIEVLFRSSYGVDAMAASGFDVSPLYCSDPRQAPFENDSQQIEYRWSLDLHLQINPIIGTPQTFATQLEVDVVQAATEYTGPIV